MSVPRRRTKEEIESELERMLSDISELIIKVPNLRSDLASETIQSIVVGDTVDILNKYKGYKGTIGIVTKVAQILITLKTNEGEELKRAPKNLKIINLKIN